MLRLQRQWTSSSWNDAKLADDPRVARDGTDERRERATDVPRYLDRSVRCAKDGSQKRARGRLAIRAGDAENRIRKESRAELDLAPHGDPARAGTGDEQPLTRDARALHDEIDPL